MACARPRNALLDRLADAGVALEVCPTSNVSLGVFSTLEEVPVRKLVAAGINVALGADDPLLFGSRLAGQYAVLRAAQDFDDAELAELARMSIRRSYAPAEIEPALAGIDDWLASPRSRHDPRSVITWTHRIAPQMHPRAERSMVLGLVGILGVICLLPVLLSPFAWYYGAVARREIEREPTRWGGRSEATTGMVCGIIGTALLAWPCSSASSCSPATCCCYTPTTAADPVWEGVRMSEPRAAGRTAGRASRRVVSIRPTGAAPIHRRRVIRTLRASTRHPPASIRHPVTGNRRPTTRSRRSIRRQRRRWCSASSASRVCCVA